MNEMKYLSTWVINYHQSLFLAVYFDNYKSKEVLSIAKFVSCLLLVKCVLWLYVSQVLYIKIWAMQSRTLNTERLPA